MNLKIDYLQDICSIREYLFSLRRAPNKDASIFEGIRFNKFLVEVAAGSSALSSPGLDYDNLSKYDTVQIFLYDEPGLEKVPIPIAPYSDPRFNQFSWSKYFTQENWTKKLTASYQASFVPIYDVFKIIKDIYKVSRFSIFT